MSTSELTELSIINCRSTFKAIILYQMLDYRNFQRYLKPGRRYTSCELLELTTVVFTATKILSAVAAEIPVDLSFQSYQNPFNNET